MSDIDRFYGPEGRRLVHEFRLETGTTEASLTEFFNDKERVANTAPYKKLVDFIFSKGAFTRADCEALLKKIALDCARTVDVLRKEGLVVNTDGGTEKTTDG